MNVEEILIVPAGAHYSNMKRRFCRLFSAASSFSCCFVFSSLVELHLKAAVSYGKQLEDVLHPSFGKQNPKQAECFYFMECCVILVLDRRSEGEGRSLQVTHHTAMCTRSHLLLWIMQTLKITPEWLRFRRRLLADAALTVCSS